MTQQSNVLQGIVQVVAVYMVEFERDRLVQPSIALAARTLALEETFIEESTAQPI